MARSTARLHRTIRSLDDAIPRCVPHDRTHRSWFMRPDVRRQRNPNVVRCKLFALSRQTDHDVRCLNFPVTVGVLLNPRESIIPKNTPVQDI